MLNNMKETMIADTLATLPTAAIAAEEKCCEAYDIKTITTTNQTSSPTKGNSIFNWLKSATKISDSHIESTSNKVDRVTSATPTTSITRAPTDDSSLLSSYREFCGVQSLRHLWNKRISASEANNAETIASARVKKLNKSISCLVAVTANLYESSTCDEEDNTGATKRRQTRTKRAQSLHDCTQLESDVETDTAEIDFLHREKDNFYKYKTAEQASKHWNREAKCVKRSSAGIVSGSEQATHFPAIKTSEKGERIHWLRRDEIKMTVKRANASDCMRQEAHGMPNNACLSLPKKQASDVISDKQTMPHSHGSDTNSASEQSKRNSKGNSPQHSSRETQAEHKTSAASESTSKRSSIDSAASNGSGGLRTRKYQNATRKYSFKTHSKSFHTPRKMHAAKGDGTALGGSAANFSMVAKLTQQFNEIIQKDKKLLQEVKRKNGVLMSRGGHVYKVVEKSDHQLQRASPGVSRVNSTKSKDQSPKASSVRRAIKRIEGGATEKPEVPAKSLQVLRKREELVSNKGQQLSTNKPTSIKRKSGLTQKLQPSDKVEWQLKLDLKKLEVVREEAKTPLEGNERSIVEVLLQNVSSYNEDKGTYVLATSNNNTNNNKSTNQNVNTKINTVNQAETMGEVEDATKATAAPQANNVCAADNWLENETAKQRQTPEGRAADASNSEQQLVPQSEVDVVSKEHDDDANNITAQQKDNDVIITSFPIASSNKANATVTPLKSDTEVNGDDELDDEKHKQRKHRYAKIYEKFRFRSPFRGGQSKKSSPSRSPEKSSIKENAAAKKTASAADATATAEADAKILDALVMIDQKLKGLADEPSTEIVLCTNDDFEQRLLPNSSFIYQATGKQVLGNQMIVTQAVNVALVNNIEGDQMLKGQQTLDEASLAQTTFIEIPASAEDLRELKQSKDHSEEHPIAADENDSVIKNIVNEVTEEQMYEPIAAQKQPKTDDLNPQESFIFKRCKNSQINDNTDATDAKMTETEDIYQTLEEIQRSTRTQLSRIVKQATISIAPPDDYESISGSCEEVITASAATITTTQFYDGYESFEPPPDERLPVTPTLPSPPTTLVRKVTDELPALPEPKRKLPKSPMPCKKLPPTPPNEASQNPKTLQLLTTTHTQLPALIDDNDDQHYYADDENIYDTIKGSHCYESLQAIATKSLQKNLPKSLDTISLSSNCYESITQYRRVVSCSSNSSSAAGVVGIMPIILSKAGSSSTISSDQKTNSLYESSLAAGIIYAANSVGGHRRRSGSGHSSTGVGGDANSIHYSNSIAASSDGNSDEWIDITDNEAGGVHGAGADGCGESVEVKQHFIVVRERSKVHRSPDWSKRVRDKRLQQKKAISCVEDDSDHYYESLSPLGNKRHSTQLVQRNSSHHKRNQDLPRYVLGASQRRHKHSASAHALGQGVSDDYDSFDTDTDDIYETEEQLKNQNDSGVDIRNVKLPDPPSSTNQVYAMVKKLKNFISNKKSPNSAKYGGSQQKIYENSSQFYVEGNLYQNSPKSISKSAKSLNKSVERKTPQPSNADNEDYENSEFHTPPNIITSDAKPLSTSEKQLDVQGSHTELTTNATGTNIVTTPRSKSKSGKSFKSRLRKSLVGSTFDSKQLSTLTSTRSTFYIEDPSHSGSGELDSGFSEKASTGDLTADASPLAAIDTPTTPTVESQKFCTTTRKAKKEAKSANSQRRRTTIGIRPHEPPPPPPPVEDAKQRSNTASTSWYAECGVFKNGTTLNAEHTLLNGGGGSSNSGKSGSQSQQGSMSLSGASHTSWYAEAGLYQTSGASVASSSGSSGVSTGNEASMGDDMPHSMFLNEPLYQIYSAAKLQSISRDMEDNEGGSSTDGYEEIGQHGVVESRSSTKDDKRCSRPTALQLVGPKNGPARTLWSEIPEVINSCILLTLTPRERCLQEAKFEIITSEASYLKSLNLLRTHFMNHPVFRDTLVVSARDRKALFSHIVPVHECSERLLTALESCWQDNIMLLGLSKRIYAIAEKYFHVYIAFCEHQGRMDRTLRRLKESKGTFSQNLDILESSPTCCGLNLHSFLMLPMQRITRLPLLIDAVFSKSSANDDEYESWKLTFAIMNKIVMECNEAANRCEQAYEIERIARQLEFPTTIRALAIAPVGVTAPGSKPRFLVKKGELTHLIWRGDDAKLTFGKKFSKSTIYAFLFSDLLVLTKRRAEEQFLVFDYCPRNMLTISSGDLLPQLPTKDFNQTGKNLILMTLLENHERKTIELLLSCPSVSEQERWLMAMRPPEAETPGEKLYEQWDCPQVLTTHAYESKEPDALSLEVGDVVNVTRKLPDGWYQGERIRDGAIGWFPGNHTEEVNSAHVRARNLKQRYRLLTFTATYLETQKRK